MGKHEDSRVGDADRKSDTVKYEFFYFHKIPSNNVGASHPLARYPTEPLKKPYL
jgi:hypothetical protein